MFPILAGRVPALVRPSNASHGRSTYLALWRTASSASAQSGAQPRNPLFSKVLIANRGEIACRIIRTAKKLGVKTVAVYSEADRHSQHVKLADQAFLIGAAPSAESYLRMDTIIEVAKQSGAQAIHPGYGFLSENSAFAEAVGKAGLTFVGPPQQAIIDMGSKSASKNIMEAAGVPCVPGYHGAAQDLETLSSEAIKMGYPVLIKAIKGGGGKGMRIVEKPEDFEEMLGSARREAIKSFGDDAVLVEKYLVRPRHVEVQVFCDTHGNAVYLFERDCSVQRRHQKVLEEAPAPGLSEELRKDLGEKAVAAAKAVNYVGAGTVEFIFDTDDQKFYFMEMNTRLQVEHPITEMITKTDLVEWQLEVASGNMLPQLQNELTINGHAFEARIYAENPNNNFLPDTGRLTYMSTPAETADCRVETGVKMGDEVSVYYDPMISKLVVHGRDRDQALRALRIALADFHVSGLHTNIEFLQALASHPAFEAADVETGFIPKHEAQLLPPREAAPFKILALAALGAIHVPTGASTTKRDPWASLGSFRINGPPTRVIRLRDEDDKEVKVAVAASRDGEANVFDVSIVTPAGEPVGPAQRVRLIDASTTTTGATSVQNLTVEMEGQSGARVLVHTAAGIHVLGDGTDRAYMLNHPPAPGATADAAGGAAAGLLKAPMPCKIAHVVVKAGDKVVKGQTLVVLEAMKMEHVVRAPADAVVARVPVTAGAVVAEHATLVVFETKAE